MSWAYEYGAEVAPCFAADKSGGYAKMNAPGEKSLKYGNASADSGLRGDGSNHDNRSSADIGSFARTIMRLVAPAGTGKSKQRLGDLCLRNEGTGKLYPLDAKLIRLGRDHGNQIAITSDDSISRNHACIVYSQDGYWLVDLRSSNGTFINGKKVSRRRPVSQGDHIVVGSTKMAVVQVQNGFAGMSEYEVIEEVGRGGMGVVYKARDRKHDRIVAIKQLTLQNLDPRRQQLRLERFRREAGIVQRLNHPNIVQVYDVHLGPDQFYFVMEFLTGHSLRKETALRGGKLSPFEYLPVLEQLASALEYAHKNQVVHRDVKPDNIILMPDGGLKFTDFGVARLIEDVGGANLTKTGTVLGTIAYSAPEQLENAKAVDHRADIFSLGAVTYEAIAGVPPFEGHGITEIVSAIFTKQEKPLNEVVPLINLQTAAVVAKAMAKNPSERFNSVAEFARNFRLSLK